MEIKLNILSFYFKSSFQYVQTSGTWNVLSKECKDEQQQIYGPDIILRRSDKDGEWNVRVEQAVGFLFPLTKVIHFCLPNPPRWQTQSNPEVYNSKLLFDSGCRSCGFQLAMTGLSSLTSTDIQPSLEEVFFSGSPCNKENIAPFILKTLSDFNWVSFVFFTVKIFFKMWMRNNDRLLW